MSKEDKIISLLIKQGEINKEIKQLIGNISLPKKNASKINELLNEFDEDLKLLG